MGFTKDEAKLMVSGEAPEQLYDRFKRSLVGWMAGGTTRVGAEKTRAQHSRKFQVLTWLQGYAATRTHHIRTAAEGLINSIKTGEDIGKNAALTGYLAAGLGVQGAVATGLISFFSHGVAGLVQLIREAEQDPTAFTRKILGQTVANAVGVAPLVSGQGGDIVKSIPAVALAIDLGRPLEAMLGAAGVVKPSSDNPYVGHSMNEIAWEMFQQLSPLVRDIDHGLFGISSLALTEDPKIVDALSALGRYKRSSTGPVQVQSGLDEFRQDMRRVSVLVRQGKSLRDQSVQKALMEAVKVEGWDQVHNSLMSRRALAPFSGSRKELQAVREWLGDDNFRALRAYDKVIERMADWTKR